MQSKLSGILQLSLPTHGDERGFFREIVRIKEIEKEIGESFIVKQVNHARSVKNTLRGIHVAPWSKIIYVTRGVVQVVIVDCRKDSPTFGAHESIIVGEDNRSCIFIPAGFGNSYVVLSENADYIYLTNQEWEDNKEKGIMWNDPFLGIQWQIEGEPLLSEKDKNNPSFLTVFPKEK